MKLYAYIAALVLVLGALWGVYHAGQRSTQAKWDAEKVRVEADYQRRLDAVAADADNTRHSLAENQSTLLALQGQLAEASKKKTLTRTVIKEVTTDAAPCSCPVLDVEFIRLWNAASSTAGPAPSR